MFETYALIFVFVIVLVAAMIVGTLLSNSKEDKPIPCGVHQWVHDQNEKLICMQCGFRPENHQ